MKTSKDMEYTIKGTVGDLMPEKHISMVCNLMDDFTRLKSINEKLIDENRRLSKENEELKEKSNDWKKFIGALETWLLDKAE